MNLRLATAGDALRLARLHVDSWRAAYRGLVPDEFLDSLDVGARAERLRARMQAGEAEYYVADEDGELLGWLTLGGSQDPDPDSQTAGEIWALYVAPSHWRQGVGRALVRCGEVLLRSRGYESAVLWVFAGNDRARRFYEAMGFVADGSSKILERGAPLEAVRDRKAL